MFSEKHQIKHNHHEKGFTLIELVVVLGIFILVVDITVSIFVSVVQYQKKVLIQEELLNQSNFALEHIARSLRLAKRDVAGNCLQNQSGSLYALTHYNADTQFYEGIKFLTAENHCQEIFITDDGLLKEVFDNSPAQNLLSDKFKVKYLKFVIDGDKNVQNTLNINLKSPRVTVTLDIMSTLDGAYQEKVIQTTVSARNQ